MYLLMKLKQINFETFLLQTMGEGGGRLPKNIKLTNIFLVFKYQNLSF